MIRYFNDLDRKENFYLPLIDAEDKGQKEVFDYKIPLTFFEKYSDIFKSGNSLIQTYKNFDIYEWINNNIYVDYETMDNISSKFESIKEDLYGTMEDYQKVEIYSNNIENYLYLLRNISSLFIDLFPDNRQSYSLFNIKVKKALKDLNKMKTIKYKPKTADNIYQSDAWFITTNGYLYNAGTEGHKSRDLTFNYNEIINDIYSNKKSFNNHKISKYYFDIASNIEKNGYVTDEEFRTFLNYISKPVYLEEIDNIPITREKNINKLIIGIVNAQGCLYKFFEDLCIYTDNPILEINKIKKMTNNDIGDILVRYCGFHKVESTQEKTITTSLINYDTEFSEYINHGWNIQFIPPIIVNKDKKIVEEYNSDFIVIKKILKSRK